MVWNLNGDVRELNGKSSSPETIIQSINQRLEKLEESNNKLVDKNYQLEIEKMKLEFEITTLKKKKK